MKEVHPVIISASRRTDLPAFFMESFLKSWKEGYILWKNPFNPKQVRKVHFDNVELVVFWSKYPSGYLRHFDEITFPHYMLYTVNHYPELELKLPPLQERIRVFGEVSKRIGSSKVVWRFDPIVLIEGLIDEKEIVKRFENIAYQLKGYTEKVIISFMTPYRKTLSRLRRHGFNPIDPRNDQVCFVAENLSRIAREHGMSIQSCADRYSVLGFLESCGVKRGACIDKEYILKEFGDIKSLREKVAKLRKDKGQRDLCLCVESVDVGEYGTCKFECLYCYAI